MEVAAATSTFDDPYPYQCAIRAADVDAFVTGQGRFHAELTRVDLGRVWMQRARENLSRVLHYTTNGSRAPIIFLIDSDQPAMRHSGVKVAPGEVIVDGAAPEHHNRTDAASHWGAMSLTPDDLAAAGRALVGRELAATSVARLVRPERPVMSRLLTLHAEAERLAKSEPERLEHPEVTKALEQSFVHAMVGCLTEGACVEMTAGGRHHVAIMARLEEFVAANQDRPVYLAEICAATGASERTLRTCCQEHLGMGPIHYLWLRRMHLTRRALLQATPATATVTAVATDHGFWELGRFASEYRALFGETPVSSLRRPPAEPEPADDDPLALPVAEAG
jgi:AraC-like DNA-binding protein